MANSSAESDGLFWPVRRTISASRAGFGLASAELAGGAGHGEPAASFGLWVSLVVSRRVVVAAEALTMDVLPAPYSQLRTWAVDNIDQVAAAQRHVPQREPAH